MAFNNYSNGVPQQPLLNPSPQRSNLNPGQMFYPGSHHVSLNDSAQQQQQGPNVNPSLLIRRSTQDQGFDIPSPLDMNGLLPYVPSGNSPINGSAPSPTPGSPNSDYVDWETGSQNEVDLSYRHMPINLPPGAQTSLNNLSPNSLHPHLPTAGYMVSVPSPNGSPSDMLPPGMPAAPRSRAGSNASIGQHQQQQQQDHLTAPHSVRLRRSKSETASSTTASASARARARARAEPTYVSPPSTSPSGTPIGSELALQSELEMKRRQIERKSREKRTAALDNLRATLKDLTQINFSDRNQSEVFENASNLLREQKLKIHDLEMKLTLTGFES